MIAWEWTATSSLPTSRLATWSGWPGHACVGLSALQLSHSPGSLCQFRKIWSAARTSRTWKCPLPHLGREKSGGTSDEGLEEHPVQARVSLKDHLGQCSYIDESIIQRNAKKVSTPIICDIMTYWVMELSYGHLHEVLNPLICQLFLCDMPNRRNSITKLRDSILYR